MHEVVGVVDVVDSGVVSPELVGVDVGGIIGGAGLLDVLHDSWKCL